MQTELMTKGEVASRYRISTRTLDRWWKAGIFPAPLKVGHCVRWPLETVLAFEARTNAELRRDEAQLVEAN